MINHNLIASVDEDLSGYLKDYLSAICLDSAHGGTLTEEALVEIGYWVICQLNYPKSFEFLKKEDFQPRSARRKRDYREIVFSRDQWQCVRCKSFDDLTVDHIIPFSKGGNSALENLQTLCRSCNSKKGTRIMNQLVNNEREQ